MEASEIHAKVMDEIRLVPKERLTELYDFIHLFRIGLESVGDDTEDIMRFAGCWRDMTDQEFEDLSDEIMKRRRLTISRRTREAIID